MIKPLEYHFDDGSHVIFDKYTIDMSGIIINQKTGAVLTNRQKAKYNVVCVRENNGRSRIILIGRAIASTFHGPPPTPKHTADHKDKNSINDTCENIRWVDKKGQSINRTMPDVCKSAFVIVRDGIEKTAKEWVLFLKNTKNTLGRDYTEHAIRDYARRTQHGFAYKEYPDLDGEIWKKITGSDNDKGSWEISNMNRVKYITEHAENVLSGERLCLRNGYPMVRINGKHCLCHILAFESFFPEKYASKKSDDIVMHENDDKSDFRPSKLKLGTHVENSISAYDNGKHDGKKSERMKCSSYIDGLLEKEHSSQSEAVKYLKSIGFDKASPGAIRAMLNGTYKTAYGRTWKNI